MRGLTALPEDAVQLPALTWKLTTVCYPSFRGHDTHGKTTMHQKENRKKCVIVVLVWPMDIVIITIISL